MSINYFRQTNERTDIWTNYERDASIKVYLNAYCALFIICQNLYLYYMYNNPYNHFFLHFSEQTKKKKKKKSKCKTVYLDLYLFTSPGDFLRSCNHSSDVISGVLIHDPTYFLSVWLRCLDKTTRNGKNEILMRLHG